MISCVATKELSLVSMDSLILENEKTINNTIIVSALTPKTRKAIRVLLALRLFASKAEEVVVLVTIEPAVEPSLLPESSEELFSNDPTPLPLDDCVRIEPSPCV